MDFSSEKNIEKLVSEWNSTQVTYSHKLCIHQLFENQVEKTPEAISVIYEDCQFSYRKLNQRANQLAQYLVERGVGPGTLVGVCLDRSIEMVLSILGVLKAGGAYIPLDPDYPNARLESMLQDSMPSIVITRAHYEEKVISCKGVVVCLDSCDNSPMLELDRYCEKNLDHESQGLESSNLAYIIYTSGSTGEPKGVMVEHQGLVNRIEWMRERYGCDSSDVILQKTPFSFDVSVWEFFLPLICGARMVMAKPGGHKDPIYLSALIQKEGVTKLHFVPSMLNAMLCSTKLSQCSSVKQVFCSGEALQGNYVDMFFKQGTKAELHNLYGPTEASIDVSSFECLENGRAQSSIPIGRPINNIQLYILDKELRSVEQGVKGELYIGGVGLARGYLNRPELTAEKFISNPFHDRSNASSSERLYKTGDLCLYLPDGNIEFLGRIDHQVKIRGFRIELGDIEYTLLRNSLVNGAVVLSKELPGGAEALVAFVLCDLVVSESELSGYLEQHLPDYMIPTEFVILAEFPLTTNGKVDRKALLSTASRQPDNSSQKKEPMSFLEAEIHNIWGKILGSNNFNIDDDLFKVGGDSISAIQIFAKINDEFGVDIYLKELFSSECFSIRWLASLIEQYQISQVGENEYALLMDQVENLSEEEVAKLLSE